MDVIDELVGWLSLFVPFQFLRQLLPLMVGRILLALFLLVLAGFAFLQLRLRPQVMRWFLAALGLTIVWEGGAGYLLMMVVVSLLSMGLSALGVENSAFVGYAWVGCHYLVHVIAAGCLLKAAFGEPSRLKTTAANSGPAEGLP